MHLSAAEYKNRIVFLHKVTNGPASQSYGLQVAALAGVPVNVIKVARNHLVQLEQGNIQKGVQPDLFSVSYPESELSVEDKQNKQVMEMLENLVPDELTPKQALEKIYALKKALETD